MFIMMAAPGDAATPPAAFLIVTASTVSAHWALLLATSSRAKAATARISPERFASRRRSSLLEMLRADEADEADDDSGCYAADAYGD